MSRNKKQRRHKRVRRRYFGADTATLVKAFVEVVVGISMGRFDSRGSLRKATHEYQITPSVAFGKIC